MASEFIHCSQITGSSSVSLRINLLYMPRHPVARNRQKDFRSWPFAWHLDVNSSSESEGASYSSSPAKTQQRVLKGWDGLLI
jgi:hypothetical protein